MLLFGKVFEDGAATPDSYHKKKYEGNRRKDSKDYFLMLYQNLTKRKSFFSRAFYLLLFLFLDNSLLGSMLWLERIERVFFEEPLPLHLKETAIDFHKTL